MAVKTKVITFSATIPPGGVIKFDCENAEVLLNGVGIAGAINGNDFFNVVPALKTINITPVGIAGTMKYTEGWF